MTDTLEEAVARALSLSAWRPYGVDEKNLDWEPFLPMARAAISTTLTWMEENVSDSMTGAGLSVLGDHLDYVQNEDTELTFKSMIAAMRKGMEG